jgi:predicted alpha/beta-fold hydrolase
MKQSQTLIIIVMVFSLSACVSTTKETTIKDDQATEVKKNNIQPKSESSYLKIPLGKKVKFIYYGTSGNEKRPAVLILPGAGDDRMNNRDMIYFVKWLNKKYNFNVLVINWRTNSSQEIKKIVREHTPKTLYEQEVVTALDYLREREDIDKEKIGLIGSSLGTSAAVQTASREDAVKVIVLLSFAGPTKNKKAHTTFAKASTRPILFLASKGDYFVPTKEYYDEMAIYWSNLAKSETKVEIRNGGLHSWRLIEEKKYQIMVGDWLEKYLVEGAE